MPKKRHQSNFSKPQSTAPASLGASSARPTSSESHTKGVNEILASLRRAALSSPDHPSTSATSSSFVTPGTPGTLPPSLRQILQIPETPPPPPRRPLRRDADGRRFPPGPRPPRSWLEQRVRNTNSSVSNSRTLGQGGRAHFYRMPGSYMPDRGSMIDLVLRRMAVDWEFQSVYDQHYLHTLHSRLRSALIAYVGVWAERGINPRDLRVILSPFSEGQEESIEPGSPASLVSLNADFHCLDLSGSIGHGLTVKELTDILFPTRLTSPTAAQVQESWEEVEAPSLPPQLLPNLTHLSLAVDPSTLSSGGRPPSWRHLLALAPRLGSLTHLSLAYWPEPSLTPNSKFATVSGTTSGRPVQYSGTGPYAHSLDDDWSEAVILLRRLSRALYRLEYLDLTGCGAWFSALMYDRDGDRVDWEVDWGKVTMLTLRDGYGVAEDTVLGDRDRVRQAAVTAERVEKHVIGKRSGKGRFIDVDRDAVDPLLG
ncbi:tafazzin [Plectosphaerella plurivora]|uniref:Tafazzin n=1 Tax=Plectosphaerella plurivora TaxID=936078 RepID=A0A9P8VJR1_9PEZI|nr:tafazzin [Plectosphaerella plurivora]